MQRDLLAGTATAGGNTVQTDVLGSSFIDILRARSLAMKMGATILSGLQGNVAIPRQTSTSTAQWVAENTPAAESQQAFDQVTLSPKSISAFVDYSRRLMLQSSIDIEGFVRGELIATIATAIDVAAFQGTGASNQPRGIINTAGIGSVAGGVNGAAPTWDNIVQLEEQIANSNADVGALGYVTTSKARSKLRRTQKFLTTNGESVWTDMLDSDGLSRLAGYKSGATNNLPSNLVKGTSGAICSAILFGNWSDLLIGMWSAIDVLVDPFSNSTLGGVRVVVFSDVDISPRHPESFAAMLDALTT